jgi:hypothetical protein
MVLLVEFGPSLGYQPLPQPTDTHDREAAYALISYIQSDSSWEFDPPFITPDQNAVTVVELGSGTGLVGVEVARRLSTTHPETTIIMTDLPEVCALLHQTVSAYQADLVNDLLVIPLPWGDLKHANQLLAKKEQSGSNSSITHIICSDLVRIFVFTATLNKLSQVLQVYFPELLAPLLRSLLHLTQTCDPVLIISYKLRSLPKETPFWQAFGLWFEYHPVLVRRRLNSDPVETCDSEDVEWTRFGAAWDEPMFVFVGRRRPESRSWQTPDDDRDLLDGIGARGNRSRKGDDIFELLLLMTMQDG